MRVAATLIAYARHEDHHELTQVLDSTLKAGTTDYVIGLDDKSVPSATGFITQWAHDHSVNVVVVPFTMNVDGWDNFGRARNIVLDHLVDLPNHEEVKWWYWIDLDDELVMASDKTIPQFLETVATDFAGIMATYNYERDEASGQLTQTLARIRFMRREANYRWQDRVHEDVHSEFGAMKIAHTELFVWEHRSGKDRTPAWERNLPLMLKMVEEMPEEPRPHYYLGNLYFAVHKFQLAIDHYAEYIKRSGWPEEKWAAAVYMAMSYRGLGDMEGSRQSDMLAMTFRPEWPDPYFGLGESYAYEGKWDKARFWGDRGLQRVAEKDLPDPLVFINLLAYDWYWCQWMWKAYFNLGEVDNAVRTLEHALKVKDDAEMRRDLRSLKEGMEREKAFKNGLNLATYLTVKNEPIKAAQILDALPAGSEEQHLGLAQVKKNIQDNLAHLDDPAVYRQRIREFPEMLIPTQGPLDDVSPLEKVEMLAPRFGWVADRLRRIGAKRVLDVGIGDALGTLYYAKMTELDRIVGIDIDPKKASEGNWEAVKAGLVGTVRYKNEEITEAAGVEDEIDVPDPNGRIRCCWSPAEKMTDEVIDLGPYDVVVASYVMEQVPDPEEFLDAIEKMAPTVMLVMQDGGHPSIRPRNPLTVRQFSQSEIGRIITQRGWIMELHTIDQSDKSEQGYIVAEYQPGVKASAKNAVIWCPETQQGWSPDSLTKGGIGGSETAVIEVARALAKKGLRVNVYAEADGIWDGVRYVKVKNWRPFPCALFVAWRTIGPIPQMADFAGERWIWAHDVTVGPIPEDQLKGVKIIALSGWHKDHLQEQYPTADIFVSGNGIDITRFNQTVGPRQAFRMIYAQSPDRGLDRILEMFTKIKKHNPAATLDIFYGFDLAVRQGLGPYINQIKKAAEQDGVKIHGRIDQKRLAREYLTSDVLLYPSVMPNGEPFNETYCISVVEAQMAGVYTVTANHGALAETNREGDQSDFDDEKSMLKSVQSWFDSPERFREEWRTNARNWASQQTWEKVADIWYDELDRSLRAKQEAYEDQERARQESGCTCPNMPVSGLRPHAGHLTRCDLSAPVCLDHGTDFDIGCSICHNAQEMLLAAPVSVDE